MEVDDERLLLGGQRDPDSVQRAQGAVAYAPTTEQVISTEMDPTSQFFTAGLGYYDRATGLGPGNDPTGNGLEITHAQALGGGVFSSQNGFGKANGLGDIALLADNAPVQIGNRVWFDSNHDGIQDAGEPSLPGVTVNLLDSTGAQVATTTTDAAGEYYFGGVGASYQLTPGAKYTVQFNACTADTSGVPGTPAASSLRFTLADQGSDRSLDSNVTPPTTGSLCEGTADVTAPTTPGTVDHTIDAGLYAPQPVCAIGQVTFVDTNGNGTQDAGEPVLPGVAVALFNPDGTPAKDAAGNPVAPVTTDSSGKYVFDNLTCGQYYETFTPPAGYTPTKQQPPSATQVNSTPDATGKTPVFTVEPGQPDNRAPQPGDGVTKANDINPTIDAGFTPPPTCTISGVVWTDTNHNGTHDAGEPGVPNVTVTLLDGSGNPVPGVAAVKSGPDGSYSFAGIACGTYEVKFSDLPPGDTFTNQSPPSNPDGSAPNPATGVTPPVTTTPGAPTPVNAGLLPPPVCAVGDFVWKDLNGNGIQDAGEPGVAGVTVTLLNPDGSPAKDADGNPVPAATTDANGIYHFDNLTCGQYEVKFANLPAGYVFTKQAQGSDQAKDSNPNPATGITPVFTVGAGQPNTRPVQASDGVTKASLIDPTIDAGIVQPTCTIGDFVWLDSNRNGIQDAGEPGVPNVTVTLLDANGNPVPGVPPVKTDANGKYSFTGIACGTYEVKFSDLPPGDTFTQPDQGSDRGKDSNPNPATGITPPVTVTPANPVDDTIDAGILPPPVCAIGQVTFVDSNGNGTQDAGEPTLAGVTVKLFNPDGTPAKDAAGNPVAPVTTDSSGKYVFDNLACGQYYETFTPPAGYTPTKQQPPSATQVNSTPDQTGKTPVFTVEPGQQDNRAPQPGDGVSKANDINPTIDAGFTPPPTPCQLTGTVWLDANHNGIRDAGEQPVAGVTVTLLDSNGTPVATVKPMTTGADGSYSFTGLACGNYEVRFTPPAGYTFTTPNAPGSTPTDGSQANPSTGITTPVTLKPGQDPAPVLDAGLIAPSCELTGIVWLDANGNGSHDSDESGVPDVTVTLLDANGNPVSGVQPVKTGPDGTYMFTGIPCGSYQVKFSDLPDGDTFTTQNAPGSTPQDASQANPDTGITSTVTLTPGSDGPLNAGLVTASAAGGGLAFTGADILGGLGVGVGLLIAGIGLLLLLGRRRRA